MVESARSVLTFHKYIGTLMMPRRRSFCHQVEVHTLCGSMVSYFLTLDSKQASCTNKAPVAQCIDWTVRGSNPIAGEFFRPCSDRSWGPHSHLYTRCRVIPGGKVAGEWRWPRTPIQRSPSASSCQVI